MTALHLRGTVLPADEVTDLWLLGDRLTFTKPSGEATTVVDGGYLLPGLVDVHTHPGHHDDARFDPERFAHECAEHVAAGTTALRVPGHTGRVPRELRDDPGLPRLVTAGRFLAWAGLESGFAMHTSVDDLAAVAVAEAAANDGWCKLIADWGFDRPPVPLDLLRAAVEAVHAAGFRAAAHCQTEAGTHHAVLAGVDSVEHGWFLGDDQIAVLAARGGAFVPTATVFQQHLATVRDKPDGPRKAWFLAGAASVARAAVHVHEAGGLVLAGTDSAPFGNVANEVAWLVSAGLPGDAAVGAASWAAREFLGLPGLTEGGLADVVAYDADPRAEPGVLRHPKAVVLRGTVVG